MSKQERKELQYIFQICCGWATENEIVTCLPWLRGNRFQQALKDGFLEQAQASEQDQWGRWGEARYRAGKNL